MNNYTPYVHAVEVSAMAGWLDICAHGIPFKYTGAAYRARVKQAAISPYRRWIEENNLDGVVSFGLDGPISLENLVKIPIVARFRLKEHAAMFKMFWYNV